MNNSKSINLDSLPELLSPKDLVNLGLYRSLDGAYIARLKGVAPDYIKVRKKIYYPKKKVLEFLENHMKSGCAE